MSMMVWDYGGKNVNKTGMGLLSWNLKSTVGSKDKIKLYKQENLQSKIRDTGK